MNVKDMGTGSATGQQQRSAYCLIRQAQYAKPTILLVAFEAFPAASVPKNKKEIDS
jgi:hypothetical protein